MLRQDFTAKSLLSITSKNEIIKFNLGRNIDEYKINLNNISKNIYKSNFIFSHIKKKKIRGKTVYYTESPEEHYCLKKISSDLKRLYKIRTANRDDISEQVLRILETSSNYGIIRIDISSFYESINYSDLLEKLKEDKLLSSTPLNFLNSLLPFLSNGLPRGLSISPVLSEIFMRNIDYKINEIPGIYYYSRYVDDIFIFTTKKYLDIYRKIESILHRYKLRTNKKTFVSDIDIVNTSNTSNSTSSTSFDYLGYKYIIKTQCYLGKRIINVSLSDDKVRKIKTRIIHSLLDRAFTKRANSQHKELLKKRIEVLSGNYPILNNNKKHGMLKGGLYYSNRLVNCSGVFEQFNTFLNKSLYCRKNNFFGKAIKRIPLSERNEISKISFRDGFINKKFLSISEKDMNEIKRCWIYKNYKKKS